MNANEKDFISKSFLNSYKKYGEIAYYIPCKNRTNDAYGNTTLILDDVPDIILYVGLSYEDSEDVDLATIDGSSGRIKARIDLVNAQLTEHGIDVNIGDVLNIDSIDYVVVGFGKEENLSFKGLLTTLIATDINNFPNYTVVYASSIGKEVIT